MTEVKVKTTMSFPWTIIIIIIIIIIALFQVDEIKIQNVIEVTYTR